MVAVAPVPIFLLICLVPVLQINMLTMGVVLPLVVVDDLAIDRMVIVVIRVVVARMHGAASNHDRNNSCCCEYQRSDAPKCLTHNQFSFGCELLSIGTARFRFRMNHLSAAELNLMIRGDGV